MIDGVSREVIGVMPAGFQYPLRSELWVPLRFSREGSRDAARRALHRRDRPAEAGRDDRARARGHARDRRAAGARFSAHQSRHHRVGASAARRDGRQRPPVDVRAARRRRPGAADRVRQHRRPGADSRDRPRPRAGGARRDRRRPLHAGRGRCWSRAWCSASPAARPACCSRTGRRRAIASIDPSIGVPLLNQTRLDWSVVGVRVRRRGARVGDLRHDAGVAGELDRRRRDAHSRGRRQHHQRSEAAADAQRADRRGNHAGRGAAGRRRTAGAQLRAVAVGRSRASTPTACRRSRCRCRTAATAQPLQRQAFVETLLARSGRASERRIGRRDLRPAADQFPLRHLHLDARRRHAVGR